MPIGKLLVGIIFALVAMAILFIAFRSMGKKTDIRNDYRAWSWAAAGFALCLVFFWCGLGVFGSDILFCGVGIACVLSSIVCILMAVSAWRRCH